ncbi:predicted protein [Nematostella vectensis]|uniref:G-protein coupled receptors family 1 profile domain-containing protein n=1 Tax=Nematostella vectensis TaxID=45351 RepID=A7RPU9_NEMVE|nr:predicted protein [Nematostella vectensis]|eukprot:XP_001638698.1 predicted protein [Nematostella vectensis]
MLPNNTNQNEDLVSVRRHIALAVAICLAILAVIGVIINGLMLVVMKRDPQRSFLGKPKTLLDWATFLFHFFAGTIIATAFIATDVIWLVQGKTLNTLETIGFIGINLMIANQNFSLILAILIGTGGITKPHLARRVLTRRNLAISITTFLVVSSVFSGMPFTGVHRQFFHLLYLNLFITLPLLVSLVIYAGTYLSIRNQAKVRPVNDGIEMTAEKIESNRRKHNRIARNFLVTASAFFAPFLISNLTWYITQKMFFLNVEVSLQISDLTSFVMIRVSLLILFIFPTFNPLVLIIFIPEYGRAVKFVCRCR